MATNEQDTLEDLAYAEAEGPSELFEEEFEAEDGMESEYGESEYGESDFYESDPSEDYLEFEGEESETDMLFAENGEADPRMIDRLSAVLGAEDEDEFFGRIRDIAKRVKKGVGKVARAAAPILRVIPHPYAQAASRVASVLGKLRAEGASTEDALEAVAEVAVRDRRALPIVAGLAARTVLKNQAATMSPAQRRQAIRSATRAAQTLVASGGPPAIRALSKVARSVRRTAAAKGTPPAMRSKVLQRTAAKVAQNPALLQKLSRPSPAAQAVVGRTGGRVRTISVPGPARIRIISLT